MANSYLQRTTGTPDSQTKFTVSAWVKRSRLSSSDNMDIFCIYSDSSNRMHLRFQGDDIDVINYGGSTQARLTTDRKFRDTNAWYHIVWRVDTTLSTADDRVRLYVNGVQETSFSVRTNPSQNFSFGTNWNTTRIGLDNSSSYFDGYISHIAYADGQSLAPTEFGETNSTSGIWKFKSPSGVTWGTNGFHLKFENSGALGTDSSGNSNTFTVNGNLQQALDTPSNVYATLNPLDVSAGTPAGLINGNTTYNKTATGNGTNGARLATIAPNSGKWYWEFKKADDVNTILGFVRTDHLNNTNSLNGWIAFDAGAFGIGKTGNKLIAGSESSGSYSYTTNDILGFAMDLDNNKFYVHKNGTYFDSGDPTSGSTGTGSIGNITAGNNYAPWVQNNGYNDTNVVHCNFGNGFFGTTAITSAGSNGNGSLFEYDVPSGYYALNTKNINTYG